VLLSRWMTIPVSLLDTEKRHHYPRNRHVLEDVFALLKDPGW